jgi:copper chaperone NosL
MKYATLLLLAVGLAACDSAPPDGPPTIAYGRDECIECGMIVTEERHAAAMRAIVDGEQRDLFFDDIGDMIEHERNAAGLQVLRRYVHDFNTAQWVDADAAWFVKSDQIRTPMGFGLLAFADESSARAAGGAGNKAPLRLAALKTQSTSSTKACCTGEEDS